MRQRHLKCPTRNLHTLCGHSCTEQEYNKISNNINTLTCKRCKLMLVKGKYPTEAI